jgi:hypothetical protein
VKSISASATFISRFFGLAASAPSRAADCCIYHDPDDRLIISNKKPPYGSKMTTRRDLPGFSSTEAGETFSGPNEASARTRSK